MGVHNEGPCGYDLLKIVQWRMFGPTYQLYRNRGHTTLEMDRLLESNNEVLIDHLVRSIPKVLP